MRTILVVGDGMADRPLKELGGRTPLEAAETTNLDAVAKGGVCGIMDILTPGLPPGSDVANLTLLGYDPFESYRGRGALEATGAGLDVGPGDVAFRGNFAYLDDEGVVVDRRAGRVDGTVFREYLSDISLSAYPGVEVTVMPTLGHRLAVVLKGESLSWRISDIDPHKTGVRVLRSMSIDGTAEAKRTAAIANELYSVLREKMIRNPLNRERAARGLPPANTVLLRGAGAIPAVKPLTEEYGVRGACVAVTPTVRGSCLSAGFDLYDAPGATGGVDTDTIGKAEIVEGVLPRYDVVFLHVKGADNASHDGDPRLKISVIEKIDAMVGHLLDNIAIEETYIAVTADHTTSTRTRDHTGDPVPVAILGPEVIPDIAEKYSEQDCARGGLGRIRGKELMPILLNLQDKVELYGS
jgi:2,3-bisphosphoglycerate-independent phosphoglycerate mutase